MSENRVYTTEEVMALLPHRYPFFLVDRLTVEEPGVKGVGLKNVTMNEEFFQGHFPVIRLCRASCRLRPWHRRPGLWF